MADLMKGHKWRDHKAKMSYPAWVEIKSDEIRCHVIVTPQGTWDVQFLSFAGKPLANMQEFTQGFRELAQATGLMEFDCGFLVGESFDDSYRWVRSTKGLPEDLKGKPVTFLLFDLPTEPGPFSLRVIARHNVATMAVALDVPMVQPAGKWAETPEQVEELFNSARAAGHEGLMVKDMVHEYQRGKRTYGWLKVKPEDDADGLIIEVNRAYSLEGTPLNRAGSVTVELEDGSTAQPAGIPHELGADMWAHPEKYIGKQWVEFRFMERDRQGGYRHPFLHRLREAKK